MSVYNRQTCFLFSHANSYVLLYFLIWIKILTKQYSAYVRRARNQLAVYQNTVHEKNSNGGIWLDRSSEGYDKYMHMYIHIVVSYVYSYHWLREQQEEWSISDISKQQQMTRVISAVLIGGGIDLQNIDCGFFASENTCSAIVKW